MFTRDKMPSPALFMICLLTFNGCATFNPRPIDEVPFKERAQTQVENNIRVTAAVLSAEESEAVFGVPLYKKGIQPVWLEIENNDEDLVAFLPVGLDPDYFAPLEVAYVHRYRFAKNTNQQMERYFHGQAMNLYIAPGSVESGFVFTNLDLGTKSFNVDLIGEDHQFRTFSFFLSVPGLKVSHREVDKRSLNSKIPFVSYDSMEDLRKALESLPCCATNQDGTKQGDPINLVIIGKSEDIHRALIRSNWDETAAVPESKSEFSAIFPWQFRYTPVKPLYLYGRHQDAAFRKSRSTVDERNQLRLWLSPMMIDGKNVWVGQISRIIRRYSIGNFSIEPNVDEVRTYILQDLWYSQALSQYAYVKGVGATPMSKPRKSLHDDPYFTDGYRIVLWVSSDPISFAEVEFVEWEFPRPKR
jgi:hypothetical protein